MRAVALTDVGITRENNEDYFMIHEDLNFYIVSDGIGGYQAGEIASEIASKTILDMYIQTPHFSFENDIDRLLTEANETILEYVKTHPECRGMGTTVVVAYLEGDSLWIANVGDSRCYGIANDQLIQLSEDHSLVTELVKRGSISVTEAEKHPDRNIITSALGVDRKFDVFKNKFDKSKFNQILLCSDGLSDMVASQELMDVIKSVSFEQIPKALVDLANNHGGRDNITVICVEL